MVRKPFLLRLDPATFQALQSWADADMRSLNAQIEYLLRESLRRSGRLRPETAKPPGDGNAEPPPGSGE